MNEDPIETIKKLCQGNANDAKVYYELFRSRANSLSWRVRAIKLWGMLVPVLVGAGAISFGFKFPFADKVIYIAGALSVIQLILSLISDNLGWDAQLIYYYEAMKDLSALANEFIQLAAMGHNDSGVYNHMYQMNRMKYQARLQMNVNFNITKEEIKAAEKRV